jgi:hypothetical protein
MILFFVSLHSNPLIISKMKNVLLFCSFSFSFGLAAQIPSSHFELPIFPDSATSMLFEDNVGALSLPAHGGSQVYDYTNIVDESSFGSYYEASDNNPNFPNADAMQTYSSFLSTLEITGNRAYYKKDQNALYYLGFETPVGSYEIGSVSMHPEDSIWFVGSHTYHGTNVPIIEYPITVAPQNSSWAASYDEITDFEITVTMANIIQAPGQLKQSVQQHDTVVGYGILTLPSTANIPSNGYFTKLVRETVTTVDSFFLGGQPAPPALLAQFSLSQGEVNTIHRYKFFAHDPLQPKMRSTLMVLNLNSAANAVIGGSYDLDFYSSVSVQKFGEEFSPVISPNPAASRTALQFQRPLDQNIKLVVMDMHAKVVKEINGKRGSDEVTIEVDGLGSGMYLVYVYDEGGAFLASRKLIKND